MANTNARLPLRNRVPQHRPKGDENAASRHLRQPSSISVTGPSRFAHSVTNGFKAPHSRPALTEVTTIAVNNRKDAGSKAAGKEKDGLENNLKRNRSSSLALANGPQRIPIGPVRAQLAPPVTNIVHARAPPGRIPVPVFNKQPVRVVAEVPVVIISPAKEEVNMGEDDEGEDDMDIEEDHPIVQREVDTNDVAGEREVEEMVVVNDVDHDEQEQEQEETTKVSEHRQARVWPDVSPQRAERYRREVQKIRNTFEEDIDLEDTTMVSEYADEIYEYMCSLEVEMMASSDYMSKQHEINWSMRQTLVDWLVQVHFKYHMLPETLWIAINIVDRFLTKRVVSLVKLQLVGVTAMFIAAKYEEILAPEVAEFVRMTECGYTKEEILKGERIVLQTLDFRISHYCSPYSWMRKISKADDYDIRTRTLSKFLTEVTLLDYRFLMVKPSLIAAVGMYCARRMLGGDWNEAFVFHSEYTEEQLIPGHELLVDKLTEKDFMSQWVCKKYAQRKFLKASIFAVRWALVYGKGEDVPVELFEEEEE